MKRMLIAALIAVTATLAHAGPIRGLIDIATGIEVPDADARYAMAGSGLTTNDSPTMASGTLWTFDSMIANTAIVNGTVEANYILDAGRDWTVRSVTGTNYFRDVAYGDGIFVAVGTPAVAPSTGESLVMTSPDGVIWTPRTAAAGNDDEWSSIVYGNGLFVAVGKQNVMTSPDGINWTARSAAGNDDDWWGVTYGNGLFVAVGTGSSDRVITSPDGINWTSRTPASASNWGSVTYGNGIFVALSATSPAKVMASTNGVDWTLGSVADDRWAKVTYGNGLFVATAVSGTSRVMTSTNGLNWTNGTACGDNDAWQGITYGNGLFVAVAYGGDDYVMTSPDGLVWTARSADASSWNSVAYGNGMFVAVSSGYPNIMTSGKKLENTALNSYGLINRIATGGMEIVNWQTMTNWYFAEASLTNGTTLAMTNQVRFPNGIYIGDTLVLGTTNGLSYTDIFDFDEGVSNSVASTGMLMEDGTEWTFSLLNVTNSADSGFEVVNWQTMTNWYFAEASLTNETTLAMTNIVSFPNGIYVAGQLIDGTVEDLSVANVIFDADFVPESANTYDIGSSLYPLNEVYSTYGLFGDGAVVADAFLSVSDSQALLAGLANTSSSASNAGGFLGLYSDDGALIDNDDRLGGIVIGGSRDVPTLYRGIGIIGYADGAWGVNDYPTRLEFSVTPDGTSSRQLGLTIYNDSTLEIYGNIIPDASNAYSIGSAQLPLAEIHATDGYFASSTLNVGGVPIKSDGTNIIANVVNTNNKEYATVQWVDENRARVTSGIWTEPLANVVGETLYLTNGVITMFDNANRTSTLYQVSMTTTNLPIAYNTYRWLVADWNSGSPIYKLLDSPATINNSDIISVGQVYNVSNGTTHSHVFVSGTDAKGTANRISNRLISTDTYRYNSGLAITEVGDPSLVISMDSGFVWYDATVLSIPAVDISGTNLYAYVTDGAGDWTFTRADEVNDSLYDTGTGTAALGSKDYGVNWIYAFAGGDDELVQVLGNESYDSLASAKAAQPRSDLPDFLRRMCFLVAQVIVYEDDPGDIQQIYSPWEREFFSQPITVHNNLSGLNNGDYQHLTVAEKSTFDLITTINDGSSLYSEWTAGTNSLYIVSPSGQYTNLLMTTTP